MDAFGVRPGARGSARLVQLDSPVVAKDQVLVRTLAVGLCGTDRDLIAGEFGVRHPKDDFLIIGHEGLGLVEGDAGVDLQHHDLVVPIVRRPDPVPCARCARGEWDMCENGRYTERGLTAAHGFLVEYFVDDPDFLVRIPSQLGLLGVLVEPMSIVEKAFETLCHTRAPVGATMTHCLVIGCGTIGTLTALRCRLEGYVVRVYSEARGGVASHIVEDAGAEFIAARANQVELPRPMLGSFHYVIEASGAPSAIATGIRAMRRNGVMCALGLSSATESTGSVPVTLVEVAREMVLENKCLFGSVNSNRRHYERAASNLVAIEARWPGLLDRMITGHTKLEDLSGEIILRERELKLVVDVG